MSHKFLINASFHLFLIYLDQALAEITCNKGCPYCGGKLYQANYPRSPFGLLALLRQYYLARFSFCCRTCRKRTTSPSVRFFGRRWFPAPIVILISALTQGATDRRCAQLYRHFGVSISPTTWKRWRRWWRTHFKETPFWRKEKGPFVIRQVQGLFPRELFVIFSGHLENRLASILQFLAPLTAGNLRAV